VFEWYYGEEEEAKTVVPVEETDNFYLKVFPRSINCLECHSLTRYPPSESRELVEALKKREEYEGYENIHIFESKWGGARPKGRIPHNATFKDLKIGPNDLVIHSSLSYMAYDDEHLLKVMGYDAHDYVVPSFLLEGIPKEWLTMMSDYYPQGTHDLPRRPKISALTTVQEMKRRIEDTLHMESGKNYRVHIKDEVVISDVYGKKEPVWSRKLNDDLPLTMQVPAPPCREEYGHGTIKLKLEVEEVTLVVLNYVDGQFCDLTGEVIPEIERVKFDDEKIQELQNSAKKSGFLDPLTEKDAQNEKATTEILRIEAKLTEALGHRFWTMTIGELTFSPISGVADLEKLDAE
jgi:hypothetical protein